MPGHYFHLGNQWWNVVSLKNCWKSVSKGEKKAFFKTHNHSHDSAAMCELKTQIKVFYEWEIRTEACDFFSQKFPLSDPTHHLLLRADLLCVILVSHKSLKIEVVNDQPTHFLLNTPPSHPLPETKTLSSLARNLNIIQNIPCNYWRREKGNCHYLYLGPLILMDHRFMGLDSCVWVCGPPHPVNKLSGCVLVCV